MKIFALRNRLASLVILLVSANHLWAYEEFIRYGYSNCMACHIAPTGGGAMTEYGREISKEALSTWSGEHEQNYFEGALDPKRLPSWVSALGGDFRELRLHVKNKNFALDKWTYMQGDVEAGVILKALRLHATVGRVEDENEHGHADLRKWYGLASIDQNHFLRIGKFQPVLGLNVAEHVSLIKEAIEAEPRDTAYSAEFSWINENWNYWGTAFIPTYDEYTANTNRGVYQNLAYAFHRTYRIGVSQSIATSLGKERTTFGSFAELGFTKKFYSLLEADYLEKKEDATKIQGLAAYAKVGYEFIQGLHLFTALEFSRPDWHSIKEQEEFYGLGLQWFPRPHFEFQARWNKVLQHDPERTWTDVGYLYLHYYL